VVESGALLKRCTPKGYPGFESLPHRFFPWESLQTQNGAKLQKRANLVFPFEDLDFVASLLATQC
jgi:hypothetical protein